MAWAGISAKGATGMVLFDCIMDANFYQEILERKLVPFISDNYPGGHRLWQDNDPKHTAKSTQKFMEANSINWWRTPAQSPVSVIKSHF